jgi:large subunit ribosomal protein L1
MPNPKSGTVTTDVAKAVKEAKAGRVEFRVDKQGLIHAAVAKVSFAPLQIQENAQTLINSVQEARPASVKGTYMAKITMTTTMGPSIPISAKV